MAKVEKTIKTNEDGTFDVEIMIGGGPGLVDVSVQAALQGGSASVATAKAYVPAPGGSGGSSSPTTTANPTFKPTFKVTVEDQALNHWRIRYQYRGNSITQEEGGEYEVDEGSYIAAEKIFVDESVVVVAGFGRYVTLSANRSELLGYVNETRTLTIFINGE